MDGMDSYCEEDVFQYPHVVVVPSVRPPSCSCQRQQAGKCRCSSTCAAARSSARSPGRNYLLKGGSRAAEKAAEERAAMLEAAKWKDLKVANHALANELVRMTTHGKVQKQSLQEEVTKLELLVQAQADKLELLQARLADAVKQNDDAQERQHARLKEVARRLKEEHSTKLKPLQDLNEQLLAELTAKQQDSSQIAALQEQLARSNHRLELEASGRAELWQRCSAMEQELQSMCDKLAVATKSLRRAEQQLDRGSKLEQKLTHTEEKLQAEQVAHSKLQADVTLERSQAALIKAELEQMLGEISALSTRYEQAEQQQLKLKAEQQHLKLALTDAEAAAADAAVEVRAATAKAERLQQELQLTKSEADSQVSSLRSQAAAREERLAAQHACRMAQLQSELDAQVAAAADTEAALAAARAQVEHLTGQVDSLRQLGDAAGNQLGSTQARLEQLQADKEQQEQQLRAQLNATQVQLLQREAELADAMSTADSNSKALGQEQARLQESADRWREKALELQEELESKHNEAVTASKVHAQEVTKLQVALDNTTAELADTRKQLAAVDTERTAAAKRSSTLMTQWEERDAARDEELSKLRGQVSELLSASNTSHREADALRQQLKGKDLELEHMTLALADEQARLASLRAQLGALEQEKTGEFEARVKGMQDLSAALQAEQQARLEAQLELNRQKKKVAGLEAEVHQQRTAMHQVLDAKSKAEEAAATSSAALSAAERKAKQYRGDSTVLLTDYDAWVQNLLAKKSSSGSGGNPPAARGTHTLVNSSSGAAAGAVDLGSWAGGLQSPIREGGLSRNVSQLASPASIAGQREADLKRYDRIAALLESRGVGAASLSRALSGKSPAMSPGPSLAGGAMGSPGLGTRASLSSQPSSSRVSPRPMFK